jgi:hypothetical protein
MNDEPASTKRINQSDDFLQAHYARPDISHQAARVSEE